MMPLVRRRLAIAAQAAVSVALLAWLFQDIPFSSLYAAAASASVPLVIAGTLAMLIAHWLDSVQMMWALARQEIAAGSGTVLKINLIAMFYSLFLPTMVAGGAIRWYLFSKLDQRPAEVLAAILFNRVFETLLLVTVGIVAFLADRHGLVEADIGLLMLVALALAVGAYALAFNHHVHGWMKRILSRERLPALLRDPALRLLDALSRFDRLGPAFHFRYLSLGLLRQAVLIILVMVFVRALEIDIGILTVAWIRSLVAILTLMPLSIAGLGIREATFVVVLAQFGVPGERALLLSLLLFARTVVYGLVGGVIEARRTIFSKRPAAAEVSR